MSGEVVTWISSTPKVKEWAETIEKSSTRTVYCQQLSQYWHNYLSQLYPNIETWLSRVKSELKSDEKNVRNHWQLECKHYLDDHKASSGRHIGFSQKQLITAAVTSILRYYIDENLSYNFKVEQTVEELQSAQRTAMSFAEVQALYKTAQKPRDRAIVLVMVNGVGPAEFVQFAKAWHAWYKPDMKAPYRVSLVREKKRFPYHVTLFEDAIDSLKTLYSTRLTEVGELTGKPLFEYSGRDITTTDIDTIIDALRERAGLHEKLAKYQSQRVRAHGFRHFFETQGRLFHVDSAVIQFATGHKPQKGDQYNYDRSHLEQQWVEITEQELTKMKEVLNVVTGRAGVILKDNEAKIRLQAMREMYKTQVALGMIKPEAMDGKSLEIMCKAVGIDVAKLVMMSEQDVDRRLGLFDVFAQAIDLDKETYEKYMAALRVMKPTNAKAAWENHINWWLRVEVGTDDYMQALADGFFVEDKEDKMRILRKPKSQGS